MKTVKQQTEVLFKALDFSDKVVMLPIIDRLAESVKTEDCINLDNAEYISSEQANKIFKVLSNLGCRTSLGESYEDIIGSCNSQKENE